MAMNRLKKSRLAQSAPVSNNQVNERWNESFIEYLRSECHLAENTVKAYGRDMVHFQNWLAGRNVKDLTVAQLSDFVAFLNSRGLAPSSIARGIVAIKSAQRQSRRTTGQSEALAAHTRSTQPQRDRKISQCPASNRTLLSTRPSAVGDVVRDGVPSVRGWWLTSARHTIGAALL